MPQLVSMSGALAVRAFAKAGWVRVGQVGSHVMLSKPGVSIILSVPQQRVLSVETLQALVSSADMTVEQFLFIGAI